MRNKKKEITQEQWNEDKETEKRGKKALEKEKKKLPKNQRNKDEEPQKRGKKA